MIIAEVGGQDAGTGSEELDEMALKDARTAADILLEGMAGNDAALAAWSAVYALRLGITHDEALAGKVLLAGATSQDHLLACLCWRWLAVRTDVELPAWEGEEPEEPVLGVMIAAAQVARGVEVSKTLRSTLGLPTANPKNGTTPSQKVVRAVESSATAYDNGPLAAGVMLVISQRDQWSRAGSWYAESLRLQLLEMLNMKQDSATRALAELGKPADPPLTMLTDRLGLSITTQPLEMLRKVVVHGKGSLRIQALRALAVVATEPQAGDLGAASAAMRSQDQREKIEAARTFFLLTARSAR